MRKVILMMSVSIDGVVAAPDDPRGLSPARETRSSRRSSSSGSVAWGGASFAHSLIAANLIDEYRLVVHPVLVGDGRGIFDRFPGPIDLTLSDIQTFDSGSVVQVYDRAQPRDPA